MRVFLNGRLVGERVLPEDHDPWLAIRSDWERNGAVRDVRIYGEPVVPEQVSLATSADLSGWLPYFDESIGNPGADWRYDDGELIDRDDIELTPLVDATAIHCRASAETVARTGVEMEALTAVQIALLTVYDMCKAVDRAMTIDDVRLVEKSGGKSGHWRRTEK